MIKAKRGGNCGIYILFLLVIWVPMACWTDRSLDFWCTYAKGSPVDVDWWWALLLSIASPFVFFANIFTEIFRSCV